MVYLRAGTGIAAAVISDGRLHHGATAAAGLPGTVAAGWGIVRRARQMGIRPARSASGLAEEGLLTTENVFEAAACDPTAGAIIRDAGGLFFEGSPLTDAVRRAVAGSAFYGETPPPVHLAGFGGNSGLMGAACLVLTPD